MRPRLKTRVPTGDVDFTVLRKFKKHFPPKTVTLMGLKVRSDELNIDVDSTKTVNGLCRRVLQSGLRIIRTKALLESTEKV